MRALHVVSVLFRGFGGVGGGSVPAQCAPSFRETRRNVLIASERKIEKYATSVIGNCFGLKNRKKELLNILMDTIELFNVNIVNNKP